MSDFASLIIIKSSIDNIGNDCFERLRRWIDREYHRKEMTIIKEPSVFAIEVNWLDMHRALIMVLGSQFEYPEDLRVILKHSESQEGWTILRYNEIESYLADSLSRDRIYNVWDEDKLKEFNRVAEKEYSFPKGQGD